MKKLVLRLALVLFGLVLFCFLIYRFYPVVDKVIGPEKTVYIKKSDGKFNIIRNGEVFYIKGAAGNKYLKELSSIGGNTIRVYDTINLGAILDSARIYNLAVIVDIYMPKYNQSNDFYSFEENRMKLGLNIKHLVNRYKNHPSLLFWNLGNEINYPIVLMKNDFIDTFNNLIDSIHDIDPNHPVTTSIIRKKEVFSVLFHSPQLDLFGFNIFGHIKSLESDIRIANFLVKPFPYYLSEYANNGPWEEELTKWYVPVEQTTTKKAEQFSERYELYIKTDKQSLGSLAFYWGNKQECTHTWFSIFDEKGNKSNTFYALESAWNNKSYIQNNSHVGIKYMLIDNKGAKDNLVYKPNEIKYATLYLEGEVDSTYTYEWNIYKEKWHEHHSVELINRPILCSDSLNNSYRAFSFKTPLYEGSYRLFVNVYDNKGNFSSSNIPFYVLNINEKFK
ncbi:glycoside hydrolase family 2 TIM barrel-domain containing protein [Algibacter mikhailovii]|uniref:glycoside hydrolase family 2 TIM barrel-domain containing protein n=1 Tax=Algibacter mikhailovii TaxID=425498 RepID=UPI00249517C3|nr:glycoside hydrolase family 2 TIM barrel-domain containing protein [Algibacter mikhailovii]